MNQLQADVLRLCPVRASFKRWCGRELAYEDLQKLPYTEAVVYEALRMYPPAVLTTRVSLAPTKAR